MSYNEGVKLIRSLKSRWKNGLPKNFSNNHYVSSVHGVITSSRVSPIEANELLGLLYDSNYYDNVLQASFDEDVTNNNIELTILLAVYEMEVRREGTIVDKLLESGQMDLLVSRLLYSSIEFKIETSRIACNSLRFINKLVTFKLGDRKVKKLIRPLFDISIWSNLPNAGEIKVLADDNTAVNLRNHEAFTEYNLSVEKGDELLIPAKLKRRWLYSSLVSFMKFVNELSESNQEEFTEYLKRYLSLLISLVSQMPLREYARVLMSEVGFLAELKSITMPEVKVLKFYVDYPINGFTGEVYEIEASKSFNRLQSIIFNETNQIDAFLSKASIYDCSREELLAYLQRFDIKRLEKMLKHLDISENYPRDLKSVLFLAELLVERVYVTTLDAFTFPLDDFNETSLWKKDHFTIPTENTQFLTVQDYDFRLSYNQSVALHRQLTQHVIEIVSGLKITDPDQPGGVKSPRSEFEPIQNIEVENGSYKFPMDSKKLGDSKLIVLLAVQKPNKTSPNTAISKYGVSKVVLGQVVKENLEITVDFNDPNYKRFNYMIYLPESFHRQHRKLGILKRQTTALPEYIEDLFLGFEKNPEVASYEVQKNRPLEFVIDCVNSSEWGHIQTTKRLKTHGGPKKTSNDGANACIVRFHADETIVENYPYLQKAEALSGKEAKVLVSAISTGLTLVEYEHPKHIRRVLGGIGRTLVQNFPSERIVVMTSTDIDVDGWWFAYNDPQKTSQYISKLEKHYDQQLRQVGKVSTLLGLDQFPFHENGENLVMFFKLHVRPRWEKFKLQLSGATSIEELFSAVFFVAGWKWSGQYSADLSIAVKWYYDMNVVIDELNRLVPIIRFKRNKEQLQELVIRKYAKVVIVKEDDFDEYVEKFLFDTLITVDATRVYIKGCKRLVLFNSKENRKSNLYNRFKWMKVLSQAV